MQETIYLTMKELPTEDRPYEKLEKYGARTLTDAELISVIIRSGTKNISALQIGHNLMSSAGDMGLMLLDDLSLEELKGIQGIGRVKALQLKAALEIGNRTIEKARKQPRKQIKTPDDARALLEEQLRKAHREELHVIMMDIRNRVIKITCLSQGGLTFAIIQPRDLFREAVKANAASIILVHNHPSGDPSPSRDDIESTLRLMEIGKMMGVNLVDHVIIALSGWTSMKQEHFI